MKVYVITQGCYSDYHICAVATDEEKAKLLKKYYSCRDDIAEIEEYDTEEEHKGLEAASRLMPVYLVIIKMNRDTSVNIVDYDGNDNYVNSFKLEEVNGSNIWSGAFFATIKAEDEDKALKIAWDQRAKMVAERFGL